MAPEQLVQSMTPEVFVCVLCRSYTDLLYDRGEFKWFELFFGLRDFIFFLKAIRTSSNTKHMVME